MDGQINRPDKLTDYAGTDHYLSMPGTNGGRIGITSFESISVDITEIDGLTIFITEGMLKDSMERAAAVYVPIGPIMVNGSTGVS